jgi:nucleoside-diphosphate-sugar epimerase
VIIGTGLIARGFIFQQSKLRDSCIYAAGVSNSACRYEHEFLRDKERLQQTILSIPRENLFVYFSTCSAEDPCLRDSRYVLHKCELENLVRQRKRFLIVRLPQVAGATPNPHTLLNYLYARIMRSECFDAWSFASRNVIDIDDIERIVLDLIFEEQACNETINVASTRNSTILDIIAAFEQSAGRRAVYNLVARGASYSIDTSRITASLARCGLFFDRCYLSRTIEKYYGRKALLQN